MSHLLTFIRLQALRQASKVSKFNMNHVSVLSLDKQQTLLKMYVMQLYSNKLILSKYNQ